MAWSLAASLLSALAVFVAVLLVVDVLRRGWREYQARYVAQSATELADMFVFVGREQLLILTGAAALLGLVLGAWLLGPVGAVALTGSGLMLPTLLVQWQRRRRTRLFERQLLDALGGMASAFRAGMTLYQAMDELARSAPVPLRQEFALTVREMRLGTHPELALNNLLGRVASEDLALVVAATNTVRSMGGNLAEMYDRIAGTIRARYRIEGRIRSLTAQGKLQGWVMGLMPVGVWLGFDAVRPDLTRPMMQHPFGWGVAATVVVMLTLGGWWIRRVATIRV